MTDTAPPEASRARDATRTRVAILRAAQKLFAEKGYATTGVREIATAADCNSSLVRRYFGSKVGLLRAALEDLLCIDRMIEGGRAGFGARAAKRLATPDGFANPVAIMALAMADHDARRLCCDLVEEKVIGPLARWLGGADAFDRAAQLNTLWTGFITTRHLLPLRQLAEGDVWSTEMWVARLSQALADGNRQ